MNTYVPIFWGLDASGGRILRTHTHTHIHTHVHGTTRSNEDNHVNTTLIIIGVVIFIGVAMQPEAPNAAIFGCISGNKEFYHR